MTPNVFAAVYAAARPPETPLFAADAKWWTLELRFEARLTGAQVRLLADVSREYEGVVGVDGGVWESWDDWPEPAGEPIRDVVRRIGLRALVRAAPFGRDCGPWCIAYDGFAPTRKCELGASGACAPVLTHEDWIRLEGRR